MPQGLTLKQAKLIKGIGEGKTKVQAARDAGYKNPGVSGYAALASDRAQSALNKLMDSQGLSQTALLRPVKDGIKATKHISGMVVGVDGVQEVQQEVPDHPTRLKASEQGWKLRGKLMPSNNQIVNSPTQIVMIHAYRSQPQVNGNGHAGS